MNQLAVSESYYSKNPESTLRLGDVIQGFVSSVAAIKDPCFNQKHTDYKIEVSQPEYCVVVSPCCSIGEGVVSLAVLQQLRKSFSANPYFLEDWTRLNRPGNVKDHIPPEKFNELGDVKKQELLERGKEFPFSDLFVFPGNDLLREYILDSRREIRTKAYMIDFKKIFTVKCDAIKSPEESILGTKILQLSVFGRTELRDKIAHYFARIPEEDKALMAQNR